MAPVPMPSLDDVRQALSYNHESGVLVWLADRGGVRAGDVAATCCDRDGYPVIGFMRRQFRAHRLAWFHYYGTWPTQVDHKDRDRANFRIANLREASYAQNHANRPVQRTSTTGCKGVEKSKGRFRVRIRNGEKRLNIGSFASVQEASEAYKAALVNLHGEFATW